MQSFSNFGVPTDPLGMLFKWRLWCSKAESQLPGDINASGPRTTLWMAREWYFLSGGTRRASNERANWRRVMSKQDGKHTTWFERQPSQRCKYRDTMSKGKVFRIEEVPAHEAPVHYSHWLWVTHSLLGLWMANILESAAKKKNVLTAVNYEALTHFSSLTQIMLGTWKTVIDQSLPSHAFQYLRSALLFTPCPQDAFAHLIRSFPNPKLSPETSLYFLLVFALWKTSQERVKPKAISFHCFTYLLPGNFPMSFIFSTH